jgi:hypothetical protein
MRDARKVLAHQDAGHGRFHRLELAANLDRRVRLHVPHIRLRRAAGEPDDNTRLRGAGRAAQRSRGLFGAEQIGQAQSGEAERSHPQPLAPRRAVTKDR